MNILHLQPELNITCGVTKVIFLITKNSAASENHYVLCFKGDALPKFHSAGIKTFTFKSGKRNLKNTLKVFYELKKFILNSDIQIIHSHHRYFDLLANILNKFVRIKTITTVYNKVKGLKWLSYRSKKLIACSYSVRDHLEEYFGLKKEKIEVIHNFIDNSDIIITKDAETLKYELGLKNYNFIFGFIGRFDIEEKGIDILLRAIKELVQKKFNFYFVLIGKGDDEDYVRDYVLKNQLPVKIIEAKIEIYDYYNICDAIVLPSNDESFSITALETGCMGKALIASNVEGNRELIENGVNGLLFEKGNSVKLTDCFIRIMKENQLLENISAGLFDTVNSSYTKEKQLTKYFNLYRSLL